jgi:3-oxoacyl-[acyl-carrier protein] reductase
MSSIDGKVAMITGAAHGLGREHALALAQMGAKVVVNDIGADVTGAGSDGTAAQQVVDEIKAAGGDAVAHYGDCADFDAMQSLVQTAVDTFGDLHIVICNAGFTRDQIIYNMSEKDFDDVVRVHLKGHFAAQKFAAIYWREKAKREGGTIFGRLIGTASESAIFMEPGQCNYGPAKAGIINLTMGTAKLLHKYGITANVVMPRARTRMTLQGQGSAMFEKPAEGFDNFDPKNATPLFTYLCTPEAQRITAHLFIVWGKQVSVMQRVQRAQVFDWDAPLTNESLHDQLGPYFEKLEPIADGFPSIPA